MSNHNRCSSYIVKIIVGLFVVVALVVALRAANIEPFAYKRVNIEPLIVNHDEDNDGILDMQDIINGAREEVKNKTTYKSVYYEGGYPPSYEGVCTDVVWRSLKNAGYNFKDLIDEDIANNTNLYSRVLDFGGPNPNIDFRRVPNQHVFFERYAKSLTTDIKPYNIENLSKWQGGDIVIFRGGIDHVGIVSDKRSSNGVPLLIHNGSGHAREEKYLLKKQQYIAGHYRFTKGVK